MFHAQVIHDPAIDPEAVETGSSHARIPDHGGVLGHGQKERTVVGIAGSEHGLDFEHRPSGIGPVDGPTVVDDVLEDR